MIGAIAGVAIVTATGISVTAAQASTASEKGKLKGNIHHSVSQWCYGDILLADLAKACVEMGIESIELLQEKDWATVNGFGLKCAVGYATDWGIPKGFNRIENHPKLIADYEGSSSRGFKPDLFLRQQCGSERRRRDDKLCNRA
jgi:hydroxypyruvate isomerase